MDNFSGQLIKGYELQERIAAGGFGAVYRANQSTVGREVAIKVILPGFANKPEFIRRFEAEAHLIARLEHPFIVPLHDYWRDPDGAYLVMRYLRGGSLHDYIRQHGKLDIEEAFNILAQVTQGLQVAHRNQVVHRDIKPGNILLDEDYNAYLGDFGIAKDLTNSGSITEPDSLVGSPEYLAPEQARSEPVTPKTDIYSLGVVLYEMLTGEHPFPGVDKITYVYKHLNDPLPLISTLDTSICNDVNDVIQKATAKDPRQRYKDLIEMMESLRQAARLDTALTPSNVVELLTPREQEVMQLIIDGKTNREIADVLVLAEATIKSYIKSIYRKLNVRSRVQAIARARDLDFVIKKPEVVVKTGHLPEPQNPYKGLSAFQAADAQNFYGRDKLIQKLLKRLEENVEYERFLTIVGPSGSGKSSAVKAGLIPALWRGDISNSGNWYIVDILPGTHPIDELEVALYQIASDKALNLREQLKRDKRGLIRVANMLLPDDGSELLIVIDQFEEIFTLMDDEDERLYFLNLLREAITDDRSRVRVIATLRADYYDRPLQYPEFGDLVRDRVETVLPLSAEELERAISEPTNQQGIQFEEGLVSRIVSDVHYQPGSLPLLQYALTELFERRNGRILSHESYLQIGGTGGALANRADEIYLEQDHDGHELIRQLFLRLVTLGEGAEDTRRRVSRSELLDITANNELMDEMIDMYATSRLLSLDHDLATRHPTVEVAHEAILREWERLRQWLNESREDIRQHRLIAQSASAWTANQRDLSYLLTGTRLKQADQWYNTTELALTHYERDFMDTCIEEAHAQEIAEAQRQAREASLEQRSQNVLRALVGVFALAAIIAMGLSLVAFNSRNDAQDNFLRAERIRLASQARVLFESGESPVLVALLALRSLALGYTPDADQTLLDAYSNGFPVHSSQWPSTISSNSGIISPDGNYFLVGTNDSRVLKWNIRTGEIDSIFSGQKEWVVDIAFAQNGKHILSSSGDGTVLVRDVESGDIVFSLPGLGSEVWAIALTPDEKTLVTGDADGMIRIWDYDTQSLTDEVQAHDLIVHDINMTADGEHFITNSCDNTIRMWDIATLTEVVHYEGHENCVRATKITPDGKYLLSVAYDNTMRLWDIETGQELMQYRGHTDRVESVDISPDGRYIISGSWDRTARLWDINTGEVLRIFRGQPDIYGTALFTNTGDQIVISSFNRIELWNIETPVEPKLLQPPYVAHSSDSILIQFTNDTERLLTVSASGIIREWDTRSGQIMSEKVLDMPLSLDAHILHDKNKLVSATGSGQIQIWDLETQQLLHEFYDPIERLRQIAINKNESMIATVGGNNAIRLWNLDTGQLVREINGHDAEIYSVIFSDDGDYMISSGADNLAKVWDVKSGKLLHVLDAHTEVVTAVAISSDNRYVLSGSDDTFVILWDLESGEQVQRFSGLNASVGTVAFSPNQHYVFGGGNNGVAILWDISSAAIVRQFAGQLTSVIKVDFSQNGEFIATGDLTSNYLWRTDLDEIISTVCSQLSHDFTSEERITYDILDGAPTCVDTTSVESTDTEQLVPTPQSSIEYVPLEITPQFVSNTNINQSHTASQLEPIVWFSSGIPVADSFATLIRTESGIAMTYQARELPPAEAVTIWWVVWARPERCTPPGCSPDDFFLTDESGNPVRDENDYLILNQSQVDNVGISLLYATGNVLDENGSADYNAFLPVGDQSGQTSLGPGLLDPFTEEIHLIARTHGTASNDLTLLHQQLNTDWGGCEPFHPPCFDIQAAVFLPVNK